MIWLMGQAGYLGRDAAGVGAEPPAEAVEADEDRRRRTCPAPPPAIGACVAGRGRAPH